MPDMTTLCLQADGTIAANADGTLADMTQEAFDACCCEVVLPQRLHIVDYEDCDITPCDSCRDASSGDAWTGYFGLTDEEQMWYDTNAPRDKICGKAFSTSATLFYVRWFPDAGGEGNPGFLMKMNCQEGFTAIDLWTGWLAGSNPVGTYTRLSGCNETSAIALEDPD